MIYTWLWNRTCSLPVVLVLHTMTNLAAGAFPLLRPEAPDHLAFGFAVTLAGLAALALIGATRGRLGWRPAMDPEGDRAWIRWERPPPGEVALAHALERS